MAETATVMREGDVFHWVFKKPDADRRRAGTEYWCQSQIAIFKDGFLGDTYWGHDDRRSVREDLVDLTPLGNLEDFERIDDWKVPFYDIADMLNLRHANDTRTPILLRKGAQRSAKVTIEHCRYKIERERSAIRSAERQIEHLEKIIVDVEAGKIDEVWL